MRDRRRLLLFHIVERWKYDQLIRGYEFNSVLTDCLFNRAPHDQP